MYRRIFPIIVAAGLFGAATSSFAQNQVDIDTLDKADKIMAEVKTANQAKLADLMSQLTDLLDTKGLSTPCRSALVTMQSAVSMNPATMNLPADQQANIPDETKKMLKTLADANAQKIETERAACIQAAQSGGGATVAMPAQSTASAATPQGGEEQIAADASVKLHDRLATLRGMGKSYFEAGDTAGLERVQAVLAKIGKQQEQDMNCRLAAVNMAKEMLGYADALKATDDWKKKASLSKAKFSAKMVDDQLENCE